MKHPALMLCTAALALTVHAAGAADLMQAWQAAQQHDPEFAAARAAHEAAQTRRDQARALWRPSLMLEAGAGRMSSDSSMNGAQFSAPGFGQSSGVAFDTSIRNGNMDRYTLSAKQPLISRERLAQSRQLTFSAEAGDAEWLHAQQSLMLRVVERYFDALLASETLRVLQQQQAAVERALNEASDRFQLGSIPVTGTHEAGERVETIRAQVLAAEMEVQLKQTAFQDLTGAAPQSLGRPAAGIAQLAHELAPLETWLADAAHNNPMLQMQTKNQSVARDEAAKHSALGAPSLDLVARAGRERLHGSGDFGAAENNAGNRMIGLQLTIPLFTGGYRSARHEEALHLVDKADADGKRMRQQVALHTRTAWLGLTVGAARITALEQARKASRARLDATRLAHSVGDRTTLDLLNAESEATGAELALLQAQVALMADRLRLAAHVGRLDANALQAVNRLLEGASAK